MTDIMKRITDKEYDFFGLWERMDTDRKLYHLEDYVLVDKDNRKVPGVSNITLNDPATFAHRAIAIISGATIQTSVEDTELDDERTTEIEKGLESIYVAADDSIRNRGLVGLHPFVVEQILLRGWVGARCLMRMDKGKFIPDILPFDMRYLTYEFGVNDLNWSSYKTVRSKAQIKDEYGIDYSGDSAEVRDYLDDSNNVIFIDNHQAKSQKHKFGYPPVVIGQSASGSLLQDKDSLHHRGESIFADDRNLYPQINMLTTILNTLNVMTFKAPLQKEEDDLENAPAPTQPPYGSGAVIQVKKGNRYEPMPIQDIRQATRLLYSIVESRIQRGSMPAIDYGNVSFPLSAVAITKLTSTKDQIFFPRLQGLGMFYRNLSKMIVRQIQDGRIDTKLRYQGKQRAINADVFDGDYEIRYKFLTQTAEQNIANYAIAEAAQPFISADTIRRDILQLTDPDNEDVKKLGDMAIAESPALRKYKIAEALIKQGREVEAEIMAQEMGLSLSQLKAGNVPPPSPVKGEPGKSPIVPLMGGQKGFAAPGKSSQQEAEDLATELEVE